ncbi:MAG: ATPase domain-containing protein [Myxococcota bacterium]
MASVIESGIEGLDDILGGGFPTRRMYLIQGDPGVGKTTLALQLLMEGRTAGERVLYVTLSESPEEIAAIALSHGWDLSDIDLYEVIPSDADDLLGDENTLYVPGEVELGERMRGVLDEIDRVRPKRVVIDSCSELRLLAETALRFRRQILALKQHIVRHDCTAFLLENPLTPTGDILLQSLVHGVIHLEQRSPEYGSERRRLRIVKLREVRFLGGNHDFKIRRGGLEVYPRLVAAEHHAVYERGQLASGVEGLDAMLRGGLDRGTAWLFLGPAGTGKSAVATRYVVAAAQRGERSAMFAFDEGTATLLDRSRVLGMDLAPLIDDGRVEVHQIDPAELSPGEFVLKVRTAVEDHGVRLIVIDSLNGYIHAMPEEDSLVIQLHELVTYLRQRGVVVVMVVAQHGLVGRTMTTPIDASYLADGVILFRYFEAEGRVRKALSVMKRRAGIHDDTIRAFTLGSDGLHVGAALDQFSGVLTGVPSHSRTLRLDSDVTDG